MKILYFISDGTQVSIGIAGDHQLINNKLYCGCSVAKSSHGWIKLIWAQGSQVTTQQDYILLVIQMQDNQCLVNNVAKAHRGKQMMMNPNGVQLSLIIKDGLPYLKYYYSTKGN